MKSGRVWRGDIVWARVRHPHKWSPALVLSSDDLGVRVSFFTPNDAVSPTYGHGYFVPSQLLPFEDAFPSIVSHRNVRTPSLHSALRFFGRTLFSALRCRCLRPQPQAHRAPSSRFHPLELLGFVLDAAVSPWVQPPRFALAVRVVAQLHAFRSYSSMKQKNMYQQNHKSGSSLGQNMHSDTLESVDLEPKGKCQIICKNWEENMATGAIRRLNSTVPVWEGNFESLFRNKFVIISENLMHYPAFDPLYMVQASLKPVRQSLLGFKRISDQGIVDICFENCSTMSKTKISVPGNFVTHLNNYINKIEDHALGIDCRLMDSETIIYLNKKRRPLDKSPSCHVFPQIGGVQESESKTYISKHTRRRISPIKMLEAEGSIQKDNLASAYVFETTMNSSDQVHKVDLKRSQHCESLSNKCEVDARAAKVKGMVGSDSSVSQERRQMSCNSDTTPLKLKRSARIELSLRDSLVQKGKGWYQGVASCSVFNSKVGQLSKTNVPFSHKSLHMKFPKNFNLPSKEQLIKKFRVFGSVDSSRTRVFFYTGAAQVVFLHEVDAVAAYQYAKRKAWFGEANVRFWLDPYDQKRRGFKCSALVTPSASRQIGPPLKSCLKNSNSSRMENRKKHCRVRFTIET
ncbi:hypothetical protein Fmac_011759 [Flemingia macrophylla]|uniref:RRM domain-containing protein n=1 Tax=Flemingia macrophylla TaxID=520843 RepID=A0ABD1MNC3_9FABA